MKEIISYSQKCEIEELGINHKEALVAFGGQMYRDGYVKGLIWGSVATVGCILVSEAYKALKKSKQKTFNKITKE